jgi:hypothetical protein
MAGSVFTKVFSYKQRENHSPIENYLTEILAFCLDSDYDLEMTSLQSF